jgi:hypothetical protein
MTARFPQMISILRQTVKHRRTTCKVSTNKLCRAALLKLREKNLILGFSYCESGYRGSPKVTIYLSASSNRFLRIPRIYPRTHQNFFSMSNRRLHKLARKNILVTTSKGLKWSTEYEIGSHKLPGGICLLRVI